MLRKLLAGGLVLAGACVGIAQDARTPSAGKDDAMTAQKAASVLDFRVDDIEGKPVELSRYRGDVLVIVNVASRCGYTPQYAQLQQVYEKYHKQGLRVLAFPANNFGGQEPGTNEDIKQFCSSKYSVSFDLFSKVSVKGDDACELYRFLSSTEKNGQHGGDIRWNFTKFLVDRKGKVIQRFEPAARPDSAEFTKAVEAALAAKAD